MRLQDRPWQRLAQIASHLIIQVTLCVADYYSSYLEVNRLESKTAKGIAKILRNQFSVQWIPNQLIRDNMSLNFQELSPQIHLVICATSYGKAENNTPPWLRRSKALLLLKPKVQKDVIKKPLIIAKAEVKASHVLQCITMKTLRRSVSQTRGAVWFKERVELRRSWRSSLRSPQNRRC